MVSEGRFVMFPTLVEIQCNCGVTALVTSFVELSEKPHGEVS